MPAGSQLCELFPEGCERGRAATFPPSPPKDEAGKAKKGELIYGQGQDPHGSGAGNDVIAARVQQQNPSEGSDKLGRVCSKARLVMGNKRCEKAEGSGVLCAMRDSFRGVDHLLYLVLIDVREELKQLHAAPRRQKRRSVQFPDGKTALK